MGDKVLLPGRGFMFWPVGTGDSSTVSIRKDELTLQIDLHHLSKSEDDETPHYAIVDELEKILPKKDGKPYLSVFALTHPDKDHIQGFEELNKRIEIGEIWHTPRIFKESDDDLCEDAVSFKNEVKRRRKHIISNSDKEISSGNRLIIIGHDDIFKKEDYKDFPKEYRVAPGTIITKVDNQDISDIFKAFIHAPFKEDSADDRNNTSLSLHITLYSDNSARESSCFFFGDREYPTIKKIFDRTEEKENTEYLYWDLMLVSHHCSKKVMYWKDEGDEEEKYKKDIMESFKKYRKDNAYEIASCEADFTDGDGDNPPHKKARNRYESIIDNGHFLCTHEYPNKSDPKPLVFELTNTDFKLITKTSESQKQEQASIITAVKEKRNHDEPSTQKVTFGNVVK